MRKYDLISSLAWIAVSAFFCMGAINLGLGNLGDPGPGFFPFLMAVCLISFSLILFISSLKQSKEFSLSRYRYGRFWPEIDGIKRILLIVLSLFMYVFALDYLGFCLSTFFFIFFLSRFIASQKKMTNAFIVAGLITGFTYAIFQLWLKANLPTGYLGF